MLTALGRLYERSHLITSAHPELACLRDVCDALLSPFPDLEACVRRLAAEHGLVDIPKLAPIFALPEGVPPTHELGPEPKPLDADFEPEPEPA